MMDLQLGLSPPTNSYNASYDPNYHHQHHHLFTPLIPLNHNSSNLHKKRSFTQVLLHHHNTSDPLLPTTLSLLPLTPSHHDDECTSSIITKNHDDDDDGDDAEAVVVGWPPLISKRKKIRYEEEDGKVEIVESSNSMMNNKNINAVYVKVKMEGEGIGRKVDLSLHHSFQNLKQTLLAMFGKCHHQHSNSYELAYQDKEGDWLLAEDVSWRSFIECAQRLKLVKKSR